MNCERLAQVALKKQIKTSIQQERLDILLHQDRDFYIEIAKASNNNIIRATVANLEDISKACYKKLDKIYTFMNEPHAQHKKICNAIIAEDEDWAEAALIEHAVASKNFLQK